MRLAQLGLACVGILMLSGIAAAQQSHLMIDPRPAPLSNVEIYELRLRVLESSPDAINASAGKVAQAIAAAPYPSMWRSPYRQETGGWKFWVTPTNVRGWHVYRNADWLEFIPRP